MEVRERERWLCERQIEGTPFSECKHWFKDAKKWIDIYIHCVSFCILIVFCFCLCPPLTSKNHQTDHARQ